MLETPRFKGWAVLELMGHRRRAGLVEDVDMFGTRLCRIDIPIVDAKEATLLDPAVADVTRTEFYGGGAIYGLHPCDEATARRYAKTVISDSAIHPYEERAISYRPDTMRHGEFEDE